MNTEQHETTYWETVAKTKWGHYVSEIEKEAILKADALAIEKTTLLDLGCDGGRWSQLLLHLGWTDIICADINLSGLNICKKRMEDNLCVLLDPRASFVPFKTQSIGLLLCIEVPQAINFNWFIEESSRLLRPGGILVCTIHNKFSYRPIFHYIWTVRSPSRKNIYYKIHYRKFKHDLFRTGFEIIYEKGFCWPPFSRSSNSSLVPYFTRIEMLSKLNSLPIISPWVVFIARKK